MTGLWRNGVLILDSATKFGPEAVGAVAIAASHGGIYAAHVSAAAGVIGLVLNDAGVGLDGAGIAGLGYLDQFGIPCATIDYRSARIGDGADCATRGIISHVNRVAARLGIAPGMHALKAAQGMLSSGLAPVSLPPLPGETRQPVTLTGAIRPVWLVDSNSLVGPGDEGAVVVTGSHGGLLGGKPETAIKAAAFAAVYNDAGVGADRAGISRLPILDARGIAAATVAAFSAHIGDGRSTYETGVLSFVNDTAALLGARAGMAAHDFVTLAANATYTGRTS
jgi:hypothetical protein